jgi:hypothetical protein
MRLRRSLDGGSRVFNVRLCGVKSPGVDDLIFLEEYFGLTWDCHRFTVR